ncbi:MAG: VOC family protein [Bacteroidota bacterium]
MNSKEGAFRSAYFTDKYEETYQFYANTLELTLEHSWDHDENKGSVFQAGKGLIEILHLPSNPEDYNAGLDLRKPQGIFMVIQVWNVDDLFQKYKNNGMQFKQELTNQSWGHRSFSISDPNGVVLFFFEEQF